MPELQKTGIDRLDALIGGLPRGSRNLVVGPPGSGKTTFAMQFLWTGLMAGETVSYDSIDRPWTHMRELFLSHGWEIRPYEESGRLLPIQAYPHFPPYERDPLVRYFELFDFEEMRRIDLELSAKGVSRFAAGDTLEHVFTQLTEEEWRRIEDWTITWSHRDRITNIDTMAEVEARDPVTNRMKDYSLATAHNIFRLRVREEDGRMRREMRIEKMEGRGHPLAWLPFRIVRGGIELE
jgi:KaiC/GvpD/RAD55 family RecA-like ATPase